MCACSMLLKLHPEAVVENSCKEFSKRMPRTANDAPNDAPNGELNLQGKVEVEAEVE